MLLIVNKNSNAVSSIFLSASSENGYLSVVIGGDCVLGYFGRTYVHII